MNNDAKTQAQQELLARPGTPQPGQRYRHYKGGEYLIVATSLAEDTLEPLVAYRSVQHGTVWTRTLVNFLELVDSNPRFSLIERAVQSCST